jgi:hypothetical protein
MAEGNAYFEFFHESKKRESVFLKYWRHKVTVTWPQAAEEGRN